MKKPVFLTLIALLAALTLAVGASPYLRAQDDDSAQQEQPPVPTARAGRPDDA